MNFVILPYLVEIHSCSTDQLGKNNANLNSVGDAIFPHNPSTAKILYTAAMNHHNLALCHVKLGEYKEAVDACILSTLYVFCHLGHTLNWKSLWPALKIIA